MLLCASEQKTPSLYQFSAIGPISDLIYQPISRRVFVYIDSPFDTAFEAGDLIMKRSGLSRQS